MTVLVVWCLLSVPVGVVLGLCIREGRGAGPRPAAGPRAADVVDPASGSASVSSEDDAAVAAGVALPAQRRPVSRQGQLHDA